MSMSMSFYAIMMSLNDQCKCLDKFFYTKRKLIASNRYYRPDLWVYQH